MDMSGEFRIAAGIADVWRGLNDPDVLARCIDGCQSMEKVADDQFKAAIKAKIGPVSATFQSNLTLTDVDPPRSYVINAEVKGGAAGFGKGSAHVSLDDDAGATLLRYEVKASVGGKLAQVGGRLVDAAARKMAESFFAEFVREFGGVDPEPSAEVKTEEPRYQPSNQWKIWLGVFAILVVVVILVI